MARTGSVKSSAIAKKAIKPSLAYGTVTVYETDSRSFFCPANGCGNVYGSSAALYQHKRAHHPELINPRSAPASSSYDAYDIDDRRFVCSECDKCYTASAGLYQHKRAKHPWLIQQRDRGYTRPGYKRNNTCPDPRPQATFPDPPPTPMPMPPSPGGQGR